MLVSQLRVQVHKILAGALKGVLVCHWLWFEHIEHTKSPMVAVTGYDDTSVVYRLSAYS